MTDFALFVRDLVGLLTEDALEAKAERDSALADGRVFQSGRLLAYYSVISLLKEQAIAYGMEPKDIGLNVDPDRELI